MRLLSLTIVFTYGIILLVVATTRAEFEQVIGERFDDVMLVDLHGNYGNASPTDDTYHKYMKTFCGRISLRFPCICGQRRSVSLCTDHSWRGGIFEVTDTANLSWVVRYIHTPNSISHKRL